MNRARKSMNRWRKDAKGLAGVAYRIGASLKSMASTAVIGAPVAIAYGLTRAVRMGEEFNQALRQSQAIMGDLTDSMRKDMKRAALDIAAVTKFSAKEAAESYYYLASAGLSAKQSLLALPKVASFAQAGMFDMAQATDLLTDAQSALGLTVKDSYESMRNMVRISDVLVKANTLANASVQQFSEALTHKAAAALRFVNKDIEEGVAVLAAWADQGLKAADAGTAMNILLRDLTTKGLKNKKAFANLGIAVYNARGQMRNIADIIGDVERALAGLNVAQRKAILLQMGLTDKSIIFVQTLIGMSEKIREYEAALRKAAGTTAEVAKKQMTYWQRSTAHFSASMTKAGDALSWVGGIAGFFVDVTAGVFEGLVEISHKAMDAVRDHRAMMQEHANSFRKVKDAAKDASKSIDEISESTKRAAAELAKLPAAIPPKEKRPLDWMRPRGPRPREYENITRVIGELRLELATPQERFAAQMDRLNQIFDYGRRDVELYRRAVEEAQRTLAEATGALERQARIQDRIREIIERVKTPMERYKEAVKELMELLTKGLPWETYKRALEEIVQQFQDAVKPNKTPRVLAREIDLSQVVIPAMRQTAHIPQRVYNPDVVKGNAILTKIARNIGTPVTS